MKRLTAFVAIAILLLATQVAHAQNPSTEGGGQTNRIVASLKNSLKKPFKRIKALNPYKPNRSIKGVKGGEFPPTVVTLVREKGKDLEAMAEVEYAICQEAGDGKYECFQLSLEERTLIRFQDKKSNRFVLLFLDPWSDKKGAEPNRHLAVKGKIVPDVLSRDIETFPDHVEIWLWEDEIKK